MKKSSEEIRERIKVVKTEHSRTDVYPIDAFLPAISEFISSEINKVKAEFGDSHKDIQVCFDPDSEEYSYPGDMEIPALVFTGILKDPKSYWGL